MHKLSKPSLMDDDDDDISGFGTRSNHFLKSNRQEPRQKDNFQLELETKVKQRNKSDVQFNGSDEELSQLGKNSSRFMKRDTENSKRVTPVRTPTPRSIATDSDLFDDSGAESLKISGNKTAGMGNSGWQPGLKKSPRESIFDEHKNDTKQSNFHLNAPYQKPTFDRFNGDMIKDDNFPAKSPRGNKKVENMSDFNNKWNKPYQNIGSKDKNDINEDDEDGDRSFGKSNTNFMKTRKPLDDKSSFIAADKSDSVMRPKPRTSKLLSDQDDRDSFPGQSSSMNFKTTKPYDFKDEDKKDSTIQPKSRNSIFSLNPDENEDDSFKDKPSSSRFMKGFNNPDSKLKDKKDKKYPFHKDEGEEDTTFDRSQSTQFLKTTKIPNSKAKEKNDTPIKSSQGKSMFHGDFNSDDENSVSDLKKTSKFSDSKIKDKEEFNLKPKPRNSTMKFYSEENDDNKPISLSHFQKASQKPEDKKDAKGSKLYSREQDSDSEEERSLKSNFSKTKQRSLFDSSDKSKDEYDYFPKPQKRESKSTSRNDNADEMFKTSKFSRDNQTSSPKSDLKTKPGNSNDDIFLKSNFRCNEHDNDPDLKRRSIRFEDEEKRESGRYSQKSSPRKSKHSKSRSPSPVTSICDEYELDPVKQKLEKIEQRRQERKRQKEVSNMNTEHRIAMEAIHTVEDSQSQPDLPLSSRKKIKIPLNKKYQNIQSKITTKPNIRSSSMDHLNNILTKLDEPNSDRNYSASQAIREATYLEWYKNKMKEDKEKKKETPVEEKETKEKRNEQEVKATYDAWLAKKKEYFLELKKKKEDEKNKQAENKENKDAKDNTFEIWKKLKDEEKKKEIEKQKNELKKSEQQKIKEAEEKKEELRKKKIEWEKRQIKDLKMKKEKEDEEKRKEEEKKNKADEKQMQAEISYKTWEEKMEENQQKLATFSKRSENLVQNRRAWRPSSNTVSTAKKII